MITKLLIRKINFIYRKLNDELEANNQATDEIITDLTAKNLDFEDRNK